MEWLSAGRFIWKRSEELPPEILDTRSISSMSDLQSIAPLPSSPVRRVVFLGTPELATGVLKSLVEDGFDVALVVTRPDKRRSRGSELMASPVKMIAQRLGLDVVHDVNEVLAEHHRHPIDLGVVVAFGSIIKTNVLSEIPMVNLHVSLLPRWRGAAPIERAILEGDSTIGVCLMRLEEGLDTGGVIASTSMPMDEASTAAEIGRHLMHEGTRLLIEAMKTGSFQCFPQQGEPTYAAKIEPFERHIDWSESAEMVSRRVRIGGAWTTFRGRRLKIHAVEVSSGNLTPARISQRGDAVFVGCGRGSVRLHEVQPEGRARLPASQWARGARLLPEETMADA